MLISTSLCAEAAAGHARKWRGRYRCLDVINQAGREADAEGAVLRPMLDPYDPTGRGGHLGFKTTKENFWIPKASRCQFDRLRQ